MSSNQALTEINGSSCCSSGGPRTKREWLEQQLDLLEKEGFYGRFAILYEDGQIQRVVKEQSLIPRPSR